MTGLRALFRRFSRKSLERKSNNLMISFIQIVVSVLLLVLGIFIAYLRFTKT
jgi:hypothetical protein